VHRWKENINVDVSLLRLHSYLNSCFLCKSNRINTSMINIVIRSQGEASDDTSPGLELPTTPYRLSLIRSACRLRFVQRCASEDSLRLSKDGGRSWTELVHTK
jgi:hypothetical protein